jgi:Zn-dependent protease
MTPDALYYAVSIVTLLFSLVVHENAHGLAAEHFGDPTARMMGRITMNPIPHLDPIGSLLLPIIGFIAHAPVLAWAKPVPVNSANLRNPVVQNAYVAAAGPASNLLLALAASIVWIVVILVFNHNPAWKVSAERSLMFFNTLCFSMVQINCTLALFNLIPIPPLDGHWILIRYLPPGPREAVASIGRFGFIILFVLLWSGGLRMILGPAVNVAFSVYYGFVSVVVTALS